ncbi:hypothetical protein [Pendulispora albinea]|uniref:Uncharacterized protein n=1 Tax=Pendulispora albinea TaxID=2741071 RepID=A0ABZ2LPE3_9BACT
MQHPTADLPISATAGAARSVPLTYLAQVGFTVLLELLAMGLLLPARIYGELGFDGAVSFVAAIILGRRVGRTAL